MKPGTTSSFHKTPASLSQNTRQNTVFFQGLLFFYLLFLAYITNYPFQYDVSWTGITWAWEHSEKVLFKRITGTTASISDLLGNIAIFLPIGSFYYFARMKQCRAKLRLLVETMLLSITISALIEAGQLMQKFRYTSINDLLMNTLGGGLGAVISMPFRKSATRISAMFQKLFIQNKWGLALLFIGFVQTFLLMIPFSYRISKLHLTHSWQIWLQKWQEPLLFHLTAFSPFHVETVVLSLLFAVALKKWLQGISSKGSPWFAYFATLTGYFLIIFTLQFPAHFGGLTVAWFLIAGLSFGGSVVAIATFPRLTKTKLIFSVAFIVMMINHFLNPLQFESPHFAITLVDPVFHYATAYEHLPRTEFIHEYARVFFLGIGFGWLAFELNVNWATKNGLKILLFSTLLFSIFEFMQFFILAKSAHWLTLLTGVTGCAFYYLLFHKSRLLPRNQAIIKQAK